MEGGLGTRSLEETVKTYFRSIAPAFEETLSAENEQTGGYDGTPVTIAFFLFLLFSLFPAIPALAYFLSRWISKPLILNLGRFHLSVHSFLFWYLAFSAVSAISFSVRLKYSSIRERKSATRIDKSALLTKPQMRFALCYAVRSEIDLYRTNKRPTHIEKARQYWKMLIRSLREALGTESDHWIGLSRGLIHPTWQLSSEPTDIPFRRRHQERFFPQVHRLLDQFSWFELDARTESIIGSFDGLRPKIGARLRDKKDLFLVSKPLVPFSFYLFTQIPDISDTEEDKTLLRHYEDQALNAFVDEMTLLNEYTPENRITSKIAMSAAKKAKVGDFLSNTVGNPAPFLRFISIWIVLQIIVGIAVLVFLSAIKNLKLDSTLIALLVGSPFAIAAALTAIPNQSKEGQKGD